MNEKEYVDQELISLPYLYDSSLAFVNTRMTSTTENIDIAGASETGWY